MNFYNIVNMRGNVRNGDDVGHFIQFNFGALVSEVSSVIGSFENLW